MLAGQQKEFWEMALCEMRDAGCNLEAGGTNLFTQLRIPYNKVPADAQVTFLLLSPQLRVWQSPARHFVECEPHDVNGTASIIHASCLHSSESKLCVSHRFAHNLWPKHAVAVTSVRWVC